MTVKEMKAVIERTGTAYATLFNDFGEKLFLGAVQTVNSRKGRLHMIWKMGNTEHVSPFTAYMIHTPNKVLYTETLIPLRADMGLKKFEVELDVV